ncbi:MAG: UDP-N-acetylglucosamine 2-epimerase, partial [Elusimicrobia bacterium RIFOXYB2_FULL_48_7]
SKKHLLDEHASRKGIFVTGNTVIDALFLGLKKKHLFENPQLRKLFGPKRAEATGRIILVTAHRRENFGQPLENICRALRETAGNFENVQIVYPVHLNPNVQSVAKRILGGHSRIHLIPPLHYLDMVNLMKLSYLVVTDSGGLQEEAPALGKPVLVLRKVTERPEGVDAGTVQITGTDRKHLLGSIRELLENRKSYNKMAQAKNPYGDGRAGERITQAILHYFNLSRSKPKDYR